MNLAIINGPNLNLLGVREPDIYGYTSFETYFNHLKEKYSLLNLSYFQSNIEGEIVNHLQGCLQNDSDGIILNAAAYTHTSLAIADAISSINIPTIEVHISNIFAREEFRKHSFISSKCVGTISGLGLKGYDFAIQHFMHNRAV